MQSAPRVGGGEGAMSRRRGGPGTTHTSSMGRPRPPHIPTIRGIDGARTGHSVAGMAESRSRHAAGGGAEMNAPTRAHVKIDADHTDGVELFEVDAQRGPATPLHCTNGPGCTTCCRAAAGPDEARDDIPPGASSPSRTRAHVHGAQPVHDVPGGEPDLRRWAVHADLAAGVHLRVRSRLTSPGGAP